MLFYCYMNFDGTTIFTVSLTLTTADKNEEQRRISPKKKLSLNETEHFQTASSWCYLSPNAMTNTKKIQG